MPENDGAFDNESIEEREREDRKRRGKEERMKRGRRRMAGHLSTSSDARRGREQSVELAY